MNIFYITKFAKLLAYFTFNKENAYIVAQYCKMCRLCFYFTGGLFLLSAFFFKFVSLPDVLHIQEQKKPAIFIAGLIF
jgi:hypothetical protein